MRVTKGSLEQLVNVINSSGVEIKLDWQQGQARIQSYKGKFFGPRLSAADMWKYLSGFSCGVDAVYESPKVRLEYLRGELRSEKISLGELLELQSLKKYIEKGDTELLEAAGVPERK
jgi:hypothetical protein